MGTAVPKGSGQGLAQQLDFKTDMQGWTGTGVPGTGTGLDRGPQRWIGLLVSAYRWSQRLQMQLTSCIHSIIHSTGIY